EAEGERTANRGEGADRRGDGPSHASPAWIRSQRDQASDQRASPHAEEPGACSSEVGRPRERVAARFERVARAAGLATLERDVAARRPSALPATEQARAQGQAGPAGHAPPQREAAE